MRLPIVNELLISVSPRLARRASVVAGPRLVSTMRVTVVAMIVLACAVSAQGAATALPSGFTQVGGAGPAGGTVYSGTFPSLTAPRPLRPGYIYLPPGFSTTVRYPVVYLLHGMPGDPHEYISPLDIAGVADSLIFRGRIPPFIAVMPAAGPRVRYNGEWAGPWERYLVDDVVPWVDAHLPTLATRPGRTIAGLSAGGFGAADIGLRAPRLFGTIESWSGYFHPLHDGPFKHASSAELNANDPALLAAEQAPLLRTLGTRIFVGSGPSHSHWFREQESVAFAHELQRLDVRHTLVLETDRARQYGLQLSAGLAWALAG
jgi:poly(3-hydroxybutyrate) depolymerase